MTLADAWGQALALMLAWPPIGPTEMTVGMTLGVAIARGLKRFVGSVLAGDI